MCCPQKSATTRALKFYLALTFARHGSDFFLIKINKSDKTIEQFWKKISGFYIFLYPKT